eukprot:COSAG06_NODE_965_length_11299_cov_14.725536_11_plen_98_part_00
MLSAEAIDGACLQCTSGVKWYPTAPNCAADQFSFGSAVGIEAGAGAGAGAGARDLDAGMRCLTGFADDGSICTVGATDAAAALPAFGTGELGVAALQ